MSGEKLSFATEQTPETPKLNIPEETKQLDFSERFNVNPDNFPIFNRHAHGSEEWNINKTLSTYLTRTAELIAKMDGTSTFPEDENKPKTDCVVYLDKSARPVSWLVNAMWEDFSSEKRPESHYLAIDRTPWFQRVHADVDSGGHRIKNDASDPDELATGDDFIKKAENLDSDIFARIRSLFIDGGITEEDPEKIMNTPTILDGKNVLIVDEVKHSGATLDIAKFLMQKAIPEAHIDGAYFWTETDSKNKMLVPTWYSSKDLYGRGIGDVDQSFFDKRHEQFKTDKTRAQAYGALVLGSYINLNNEPPVMNVKNPSRELAAEIVRMRDLYESGNIAFMPPMNYSDDVADKACEDQGIVVSPDINNRRSTIYLKTKILDKKPRD